MQTITSSSRYSQISCPVVRLPHIPVGVRQGWYPVPCSGHRQQAQTGDPAFIALQNMPQPLGFCLGPPQRFQKDRRRLAAEPQMLFTDFQHLIAQP